MPQLGVLITTELETLVKQAAELDKRSMASWIRITLEREAIKAINESKVS